MSDIARRAGAAPAGGTRQQPTDGRSDGANLADILERVLDKGIVIAGDIQVNLLDIELLTIKIRLVVASVDRAKEMGIDWWERDPTLSAGRRELEDENRDLRARVEALERNGPGRNGRGSAGAIADDLPDEDPADDDRYADEATGPGGDVVGDDDIGEGPADGREDDVEPVDGRAEDDGPSGDDRQARGNGRTGRAGRSTRATTQADGAERAAPARRRPAGRRSPGAQAR